MRVSLIGTFVILVAAVCGNFFWEINSEVKEWNFAIMTSFIQVSTVVSVFIINRFTVKQKK